MKILFTAGGSGGHITPTIAVARAIRAISEEKKIVSLNFVLVGNEPIDPELLEFEEIRFRQLSTGKLRRYFSFKNITDSFKTIRAFWKALFLIYGEFPDVIFSNGGYVAAPVLFAARFFRIPIIIQASDTVPGKVVSWAGKFARRVAVAFPETISNFAPEKTAHTGQPIRTRILGGNEEEAIALFQLERNVPTILILGGSQGAQPINNTIIQIADKLVEQVQIIHQCGKNNYADVLKEVSVILEKSPRRHRYHAYGFLTEDQLRNASRMARIIISRGGANSIFEIAAWGVPSILIPLPHSAGDHQRKNAYTYARAGGCEVMEESNMTPMVLYHEIIRLMQDENKRAQMQESAQKFARLDAAEKIAREIIKLGLHEE